MTKAVRLIKKYPNRRLYDTQNSVYITLAEIKDMILRFEEVQVIDLKSKEDLTRSILLQIILEEETGIAPLFSSEMLVQMIRLYGHAMQSLMGTFLESNVKAFIEMQHAIQDKARLLYGDDQSKQANFWTQFFHFQGPAWQTMANTYMEQSQQVFQNMQSSIRDQTEKMLASSTSPTTTRKLLRC